MKRFFLLIFLISQLSHSQSVSDFLNNIQNQKTAFSLPISSKEKINLSLHERKNSFSEKGIQSFVAYENEHFVGVISVFENTISGEIFYNGKNYTISSKNGKINLSEEHFSQKCGTCENGNCQHSDSKISSFYKKSQPKIQAFNKLASEENKVWTDNILRIYRLAAPVDYNYFKSVFHSNIDEVKAFWASLETGLNERFVRDLGIKFQVITDEKLIITSQEKEIFKNYAGKSIINLSTLEINKLIGKENYDLGIFLAETTTGESGLADISAAYENSKAAARAYPNVATIAHEIGHLFGGIHTMSNGNNSIQTEPNHGASVMSYGQRDNYPRDFFSLVSIYDIRSEMQKSEGYFVDNQRLTKNGFSKNPPLGIESTNLPPVIDRTKLKAKYQLPPQTSFQFEIKASDPDNDPLFYAVHQADRTSSIKKDKSKARFYSQKPTSENIIRFDAKYNFNLRTRKNELADYTQFRADDRGEFSFWLGVNDANISKENHATRHDVAEVKIEIVEGKPFKILSKVGNLDHSGNETRKYKAGQKTLLKWQVDENIFAKDSRVRILMSDDFGKSWNYVLEPNTENDGEQEIFIPNIDAQKIIKQTENAYSNQCLFRIEVLDHIATAMTDGGFQPMNGGFKIEKSDIQFKNTPPTFVKIKKGQVIENQEVTAISSCRRGNVKINFKEEEKDNVITRIWEAVDYCENTAYFVQKIEIQEDTPEPPKNPDSGTVTPTTPEPPKNPNSGTATPTTPELPKNPDSGTVTPTTPEPPKNSDSGTKTQTTEPNNSNNSGGTNGENTETNNSNNSSGTNGENTEPNNSDITNEKNTEKSTEFVIYNGVSTENGSENYFRIENLSGKYPTKVEIFTELGQKVYENDNYGVNGAFFKGFSNLKEISSNTEKLPKGVYFYLLWIENEAKPRKGYLYLK